MIIGVALISSIAIGIKNTILIKEFQSRRNKETTNLQNVKLLFVFIICLNA